MIEMRFKCMGKSSSVSEDGVTTWTVKFVRVFSSGEIELAAKVKTTSRGTANKYDENMEYVFPINEDGHLGGVFENAEDNAPSPETLEELVDRVTREILGQDPSILYADLREQISERIHAEISTSAVNIDNLYALIDATVCAYQAEQRRTQIRTLAKELSAVTILEGAEAGGVEELAEIVFHQMYPDGAALDGEEYQEIRHEVEVLLAERAAREVGEEPEPEPEASGGFGLLRREETLERKVARITRDAYAAIPVGANPVLKDVIFDVANKIDDEEGPGETCLDAEQFESLVGQITPMVQAVIESIDEELTQLMRKIDLDFIKEEITQLMCEKVGSMPKHSPSDIVYIIANEICSKKGLTDDEFSALVKRLVPIEQAARMEAEAAGAEETEHLESTPPKKRGRPKGSKNKPALTLVGKEARDG